MNGPTLAALRLLIGELHREVDAGAVELARISVRAEELQRVATAARSLLDQLEPPGGATSEAHRRREAYHRLDDLLTAAGFPSSRAAR